MLRVLLIVLTLPALLAGAAAHAADRVLVVLSKPQESYTKVAEGMQATLAARGRANLGVTVVTLADFLAGSDNPDRRTTRLIVTVGTQAARELAASHPGAPLLHTLIPRQSYAEVAPAGNGRQSVLYLDQPMARQLVLVRLALPQRSRIGVLLGPASAALRPELEAAAQRQGLQSDVRPIASASELLPTLNKVLEDNDVLLSVADPMVFNSNTIHHVLLTTYRYRVPVVGLSRAYVDAGAVLAVFTTPEQVGRQAGELIAELAVAGTWKLPPPQSPKYYSVAVNRRVAASLGLRLETEAELLRRLQAAEATP